MTKKAFQDTVWNFYKKHGRKLPWRNTKDPYRIWVSEVMLQQTQVSRVLPKYKAFLKKFPTIHDLAQAPLRDVLVMWQGLGYNRRAKLLHAGAKYVVHEHGGKFPKEHLTIIPGIGSYTEGAIQAFAYNKSVVCIETNIRTVFLHHFFQDAKDVHDKEIKPLIKKMCDQDNPREWYWALMDYGSYLKQQGIKLNSKSAHYAKQSTFKGSKREVRGAIIKALSNANKTKQQLQSLFPGRKEEVGEQIAILMREGFIQKNKLTYTLAT